MRVFTSPYRVENGVVYWNSHVVRGADAASFQALNTVWAIDAHSVFVQNAHRRGIHRASFRLLNPVFAVDRRAAHDWAGPIKGADPLTFEAMDSGLLAEDFSSPVASVGHGGYARDRRQVYFHRQGFHRATPVRAADPATFQSYRNGFGTDRTAVYYERSRLAMADPTGWVYLGRGYSTDGQRAYHANRLMAGVACARFRVIDLPTFGGFATDGERWFNNDREVSRAEFWREIGGRVAYLRDWTSSARKAKWET